MGTTGALTKNETSDLTPFEKTKLSQSVLIAKTISSGQPIEKAANELGISKRTAYRRLSETYCQELIENSLKLQVASVPGTTKKLIQHCFAEDPKISLDAIKIVHENVGIRPSRAPNQFITNIYNQTNIGNLSPVMGNLVYRLHADQETPDADFEEILEDD